MHVLKLIWFLEYANELEQAEFYEEQADTLILFFFECYLLMINKIWVLEGGPGSGGAVSCSNYAFGLDIFELEYENDQGDPVQLDKIKSTVSALTPTNSHDRDKWFSALKKEKNSAAYFRFPVVFSKLLQFLPIGKLLVSPLADLLIHILKRLLHEKNLPELRVEGLKILLNWLKAMSYQPATSGTDTEEFVSLFGSLVNVENLIHLGDGHDVVERESVSELRPLAGFEARHSSPGKFLI